jgi:catechol 2,3-dioxygenase-like lactoylglutathione lyase family enzyme
MNLNQVTLPVKNLPEAVAFYRKLGFEQVVNSPHYARFACPDEGATFSLHLADETGPSTAVVYFESDSEEELREQVQALQQAGVVFDEEPTLRRWLWLEAPLRDPAGNRLIFYFAGVNRLNPPWRLPRE